MTVVQKLFSMSYVLPDFHINADRQKIPDWAYNTMVEEITNVYKEMAAGTKDYATAEQQLYKKLLELRNEIKGPGQFPDSVFIALCHRIHGELFKKEE